MQNIATIEIDPIIEPFDITPEPRMSSFERSLVSAWKHADLAERSARLSGMIDAYLCDENYEHFDDLIFLQSFCETQENGYTGPERRRAFYPLSRMNIAGNLLADIALHPAQYTEHERQQRVADWNSTTASAWNSGPEALKFCEKRGAIVITEPQGCGRRTAAFEPVATGTATGGARRKAACHGWSALACGF